MIDPDSWKPIDVNGDANGVAPGAATNTFAGITFAATSPVGDLVTYTLTDNADGLFKVLGGHVRAAKAIPINGPSFYTITVLATAGNNSLTATFLIDVRPDLPPNAVRSDSLRPRL